MSIKLAGDEMADLSARLQKLSREYNVQVRKEEIAASMDLPEDKIEMIQKAEPLTEVDVLLYRNGSEITKRVELGIRPRKYVWTTENMDDFAIDLEGLGGLAALGELGDLFVPRFDVGYAWGGKGRLGVYVDDLSEGLAEYFKVPDGRGVLVEEIVEGGAAEKAGIRAGDVIIEIDGESVGCTDELSKAISTMSGDVPTPIVIIRNGERITVDATVEKTEDRVLRLPASGIFMYGDDADSLIKTYKLEASKEALEEQLEELRDAIEEPVTAIVDAVKFTLDKSTGENQGVRIFSRLIKVKPGWGYVLSFSCRTRGSHARVFTRRCSASR